MAYFNITSLGKTDNGDGLLLKHTMQQLVVRGAVPPHAFVQLTRLDPADFKPGLNCPIEFTKKSQQWATPQVDCSVRLELESNRVFTFDISQATKGWYTLRVVQDKGLPTETCVDHPKFLIKTKRSDVDPRVPSPQKSNTTPRFKPYHSRTKTQAHSSTPVTDGLDLLSSLATE